MELKSIGLFMMMVVTMMGLHCPSNRAPENTPISMKDITLVQEAHTRELMGINGVVGVYVGALDDGTPCIAVMVDTLTPELTKKLPKTLEGYPVRVEETGTIKPLSR